MVTRNFCRVAMSVVMSVCLCVRLCHRITQTSKGHRMYSYFWAVVTQFSKKRECPFSFPPKKISSYLYVKEHIFKSGLWWHNCPKKEGCFSLKNVKKWTCAKVKHPILGVVEILVKKHIPNFWPVMTQFILKKRVSAFFQDFFHVCTEELLCRIFFKLWILFKKTKIFY